MYTAAQTNRLKRAQAGFTLIELITVIIVIGILVAVVTSGSSPLSSSRIVHANSLRSHIRYAQSRAMKSGQVWGINCNGAAYWLFNGSDPTISTTLPGETTPTVVLSTLRVSLPSFLVAFDIAGRPYSDAALTTILPNTALTLASSDDPTATTTITIIRETGYIQ